MATNFYKVGTSYYRADNNQKILTPADLQELAKTGKEISAPKAPSGSTAIPNPQAIKDYNVTANIGGTLYGTPKIAPISNKMDAPTIQVGLDNSNAINNLPDQTATQTAIDIYTKDAQSTAEKSLAQQNKELATLQAQQLKQNQAEQVKTQSELDALQAQRQSDLDTFKTQTEPINQNIIDTTKKMTDALGQYDYQGLIKQKIELTNDIVNYSKLMRQELDVEASRPAMLSVSQGRQTAIQQNYLSKIATAEAANAAIDGNFTLSNTILENATNNINNITVDKLNFLNYVENLYGTQITDAKTKLLNLSEEEKAAISELKTKLQKDIENAEKNKETIQNLMSNPATAMIAHKAGLTLTDTQDVVAEKLNKYYIQNPTLIPESVVALQAKYPDAGINFWDTPEVIQSKLKKSVIFKNETGDSGLSQKDLIDQAQKLVDSGQAADLADAINQIQTGLGTNLGEQVGTIQGLPAYDTRTNNPGVTRANRNNNPGNIKLSSYTKTFNGVIGVESSSAQDGGNFLIFDSAESGINAIGKLLREGKSYQGVNAETAIKRYNGNGAYGAADVGLDPNKDFQSQIQDSNKLFAVATAIAQAEGFKIKQTPDNTSIDGWVKLIQSGQAKLDNVPQKDRSAVVSALANSDVISKADEQLTSALQEQITTIDSLIDHPGFDSAVGPSWTGFFTRNSILGFETGQKADFIAGVTQLIDQKTLDTLLNLKKAGGTLGALSEGEKAMLRSAASKIGTWEVKDDAGNIKGYKINEKYFKQELETIKRLSEKALKEASSGIGIVNSIEQYLANNPDMIDEYNLVIQTNPNLTEDEVLQVLGQ